MRYTEDDELRERTLALAPGIKSATIEPAFRERDAISDDARAGKHVRRAYHADRAARGREPTARETR